MQALRSLGVLISLDDFGTGYSALNYLWRYPLDKLKIDRSFVAAYLENDEAKGVLNAIVDLGRRLNLPVVAEGVENEAQRLHLSTLGCELAQGFLFGKAVPAADLPGLILREFSDQLQPAGARAQSGEDWIVKAAVGEA
jgi:EAL domain-containing protein (putative c-di-GMP-specific phosphodiesterase class I)